MTFKLPAIPVRALLIALSATMAIGLVAAPASAVEKPKSDDGRKNYSQNGPNVSYQQGPHTRVYVTKRSWLDAGVEVLPGDRKFTDYAFPQSRSFGNENYNRPLDRIPLNPASDMGGYSQSFPLY
jgi:hypothetical protein